MLKNNKVQIIGLGACALIFTLACSVGVSSHGNKDWPVPEAARKVPNPVKSSPAVLAAAKKIYVETCEQCHGEKGKGDGSEAMMYSVKPANFTDHHMMSEMTDGEIFYKITEGRKPMPGFKNSLTEEQRWQMVHFVRTFAKPPAAPPAKKAASPKH